MSRIPITRRQEEVLVFLRDYIRKEGYPPTYREIAGHLNLASTNGVQRHLKALETKGYVELLRSRARGIRVLGDDEESETASVPGIPLVGRVAAGMPIVAEENIEERLYIDEKVFGPGVTFALTVQGDSMKNAGILDGDLVVIKMQPVANNGQIVVALLSDEATVKRFFDCGDWIELRPENPDYATIKVMRDDPEGVLILGIVVGVMRRYLR